MLYILGRAWQYLRSVLLHVRLAKLAKVICAISPRFHYRVVTPAAQIKFQGTNGYIRGLRPLIFIFILN